MTTTSLATAPERRVRYHNLDGLRGVAALSVLVYHGLLVIPSFANPLYGIPKSGSMGWLDYSPLRVLVSGTEAVLIFFVLSGFVLTLPVVRRREAGASFEWRAYYPSRLTRLYLPVVGAIIWSLIVVAVLPRLVLAHAASPFLRDHAEIYTPVRLIRDVLLVDGTNSLDGPLWSLQWEVLFSLLLPLYVFLAVRLEKHWVKLAFLFAAIMAVATVVNRPSLEYLPAFGIGALLATALPRVEGLIRRINGLARHRAAWSLISIAAVLLLTARWTVGPHLPPRFVGLADFPVALGATLFVFIALGSGLAKRFLGTRGVQWLGTISFSLYLTHEPIVVGVAQLLPRVAQDYTVLIATPLSLLVGWGFFLVVEKPAHRASQWLRHRISASTPTRALTQPLTPASSGQDSRGSLH